MDREVVWRPDALVFSSFHHEFPPATSWMSKVWPGAGLPRPRGAAERHAHSTPAARGGVPLREALKARGPGRWAAAPGGLESRHGHGGP